MSTRSITRIHQMKALGEEKIVCSFYRHSDGYPSGHGDDLAGWLKGKRLVNGIGADFVSGRDFNRAGTMAVQLMAYIQKVSGCEVTPTGKGCEEYTYHVYFDEKFLITCEARSGEAVQFSAEEFKGENIESLWWEDE